MNPQQEKKLNEVHDAIVGNESIGHKGIITRLIEVEVEMEKNKQIKNKVIGGVVTGGFFGSGIATLIHYLFK
ncbi:MAG: hypothetical protein V4538_15640 [Bacteroidota bacterium]